MGKRGKGKTGEGQYAPLTYGMLKSPAWRSLSGAAVKVFLELHTRFNGSNNGKVRLSYAEAAEALGIGKATVQRAFEDLQAKGFLVLENEGNWYHRRAHEWRLTVKPVQQVKGRVAASNDWRNWRPRNAGRGSGSGQKGGSVVPFQNPRELTGSETEPVRDISGKGVGSGSEHS